MLHFHTDNIHAEVTCNICYFFNIFSCLCVFWKREGGIFLYHQIIADDEAMPLSVQNKWGICVIDLPGRMRKLVLIFQRVFKAICILSKKFQSFFFCKIIPHFSADSQVSYHKVNYFVRRWCFWWMSYIYWNENNFEVNNIVGKK